MNNDKFVLNKKEKQKKLIIYGTGALAEVAYFYFTFDSIYEVVSFTVESAFITVDNFKGLSVIPFEEIENYYPPDEYEMFVAVGYRKLNDIRVKFYKIAKKKGYKLASYVSSYCVNLAESIGDNCFILENNTIQPFTKIGNNVIIWSSSYIGHHVTIEDNCFIASNVSVSGFCKIGRNSFIGVGATIVDNIMISEYNLIGAGALITRNTKPYEVYKGNRAVLDIKKSIDYFK